MVHHDPQGKVGSYEQVCALNNILDTLTHHDELWGMWSILDEHYDCIQDPTSEWRFLGHGKIKFAVLHIPTQVVYKSFAVTPHGHHENNLKHELFGRERFPEIDGACHTQTSYYFYGGRGYVVQPYYETIRADYSLIPKHVWTSIHAHQFADTMNNFTVLDNGSIEFFDAWSGYFEDDEYARLLEQADITPWPNATPLSH